MNESENKTGQEVQAELTATAPRPAFSSARSQTHQPARINQPQTQNNQDNGPRDDGGTNMPRRRKAPRYKDRRDLPRPRRLVPIDRPSKPIDESASKDALKIIPLGGLGEVGRNMCVFEYKNDIIIIDVGFGFAEDDMPGIDYTLPNINYLDGKQDRIRGIVLTHGHMDHVGGLPYLIQRLGNPPIYASELTRAIVLKRHQEFT